MMMMITTSNTDPTMATATTTTSNSMNNNNSLLNGMSNNGTGGPKPRGRRKKVRTEPVRPICPQCEKQFSNQSALTKHKLTHSDERKFACQQCSKAFKRHDHLTGHMQTHSNRKPFNCDVQGCDKTYCDARSLRRHKENIHHIVTPKENNNSNSSSSSSSNQHQHQNQHQQQHHQLAPSQQPNHQQQQQLTSQDMNIHCYDDHQQLQQHQHQHQQAPAQLAQAPQPVGRAADGCGGNVIVTLVDHNNNNNTSYNNQQQHYQPQQQQHQQQQQHHRLVSPANNSSLALESIHKRRVHRLHSDGDPVPDRIEINVAAVHTLGSNGMIQPAPATLAGSHQTSLHHHSLVQQEHHHHNNNNSHHHQHQHHPSYSADYASTTRFFTQDYIHTTMEPHQSSTTHAPLGTPLAPHSAASVTTDSGLALNIHYEQQQHQQLTSPDMNTIHYATTTDPQQHPQPHPAQLTPQPVSADGRSTSYQQQQQQQQQQQMTPQPQQEIKFHYDQHQQHPAQPVGAAATADSCNAGVTIVDQNNNNTSYSNNNQQQHYQPQQHQQQQHLRLVPLTNNNSLPGPQVQESIHKRRIHRLHSDGGLVPDRIEINVAAVHTLGSNGMIQPAPATLAGSHQTSTHHHSSMQHHHGLHSHQDHHQSHHHHPSYSADYATTTKFFGQDYMYPSESTSHVMSGTPLSADSVTDSGLALNACYEQFDFPHN